MVEVLLPLPTAKHVKISGLAGQINKLKTDSLQQSAAAALFYPFNFLDLYFELIGLRNALLCCLYCLTLLN